MTWRRRWWIVAGAAVVVACYAALLGYGVWLARHPEPRTAAEVEAAVARYYVPCAAPVVTVTAVHGDQADVTLYEHGETQQGVARLETGVYVRSIEQAAYRPGSP